MVTMKKIAELCGVSRGTVDRALNGRGREMCIRDSLEDRHDIPKVIFVLGESTSRHHMQLYGYNLPTTRCV